MLFCLQNFGWYGGITQTFFYLYAKVTTVAYLNNENIVFVECCSCITQTRIRMDNVHFSHIYSKDEHGLSMVMEYTYEKQDATNSGHR